MAEFDGLSPSHHDRAVEVLDFAIGLPLKTQGRTSTETVGLRLVGKC